MTDARVKPAVPRAASAVVALVFLLHLLPRPGFGFHRDTLLYLAMGDHLDLFRMQFPPMIALLARIADVVPGSLLFGTRLLPALALAALMALGMAMAFRMGCGPRARLLVAVALAASPMMEGAGALFQPVIFELLWWALAAYALTVLLDGGGPRWWLVLGLAMGLGGLTKFSAAVFGIAMAVAVLLSPLRSALRTRWPWLAVLLGALVALPSVTGQVAHGWPFFAQLAVLREGQLERVSPLRFLAEQALLTGAGLLVVLPGLAALLLQPALARFRPLAFYALTACAILLVTGGKAYYLAPVHLPLFAAGAVSIASLLRERAVARGALLVVMAAGGIAFLPIVLPLWPPPTIAAYAERLGVSRATETNVGTQLPLPQDLADMTGWREQVAEVAKVFHALPAATQARTVIVAGNYGRAGALAVYHGEFGLPYPASRSGDFWAWGPGQDDPEVVIIVGGTVEDLRAIFADVREAGRSTNAWGVEEEQDVPIHVCRGARVPLGQLWQRLGPEWG